MSFGAFAKSFFNGEMRRQRAINRLQAAQIERTMKLYAGAEPGNRRNSPNQLSQPDDFKQAYQRITLIRAARQLEEDFAFCDGILGDFETYVVGNLRYIPDTGNPDANKVIADYLDREFDQCDYSQRLDLTKIARLAIRTQKRDGECGFIPIDRGDSIKLDYLSGDRIGNPMTGFSANPIDYNGIIIDPITGAPVQYNIFSRMAKMNAYLPQATVPADNFFHFYDPFRFEQYHGVSIFKNAITNAFDIEETLEYTKLNIKWRASQLPYIVNEQGKPRGNGYVTQPMGFNGEPQAVTTRVDGVTQNFLKLGEGVMEYPNDFPNGQFGTVQETLRRDIAVSAKLPLEFVYASQSGGVVQRFFVNKAERTFDEDKRWLKKVLLNPYKNRSIQNGIETGLLDLSKYGTLSRDLSRFRGKWQLGRNVSVDYGREVDADIKLMDAGVISPQEYAQENDSDISQVRREIEENTRWVFSTAEQIAKETGQDIAVIIPFLLKKFPNPGAGLSAAGAPTEVPAQTTAE